MARPRKVIDEKFLRLMAESNLNNEQIADRLSISVKTLNRRYVHILKDARSSMKTKLAIKALQMALKGHWPALKYQLSNQLGWSERTTIDTSESSKPFTLAYTVDDLKKESDDQT
jgi:hypothetical protein